MSKHKVLHSAKPATRAVHSPQIGPEGFNALATPVYRGSSTFFENTAAQRTKVDVLGLDYSYGLHGNPTQYTLAQRLAEIEGAMHCLVCPSGLNAITLIAMAVLKTGQHWLIPGNVYNPVHALAVRLKADFDIAFDVYDPLNLDSLEQLIRPETRLLWAEAPGSITFEVPDLSRLLQIAAQRDLITAIDNTWSAGLAYKPFQATGASQGFDFSVQALTKYQCGHADVLMGAVLSSNTAAFAEVEKRNRCFGVGVSPEDCALVLRGLLTLPLRYKAQGDAAVEIAHWLAAQPEVGKVLHPALPDCPGHEHFKTHFTGSASVFSILLKPDFGDSHACRFVDALNLFKIAYSWGGPESLALAGDLPADRLNQILDGNGSLVRLAIGLEDVDDLKADLRQALTSMQSDNQ